MWTDKPKALALNFVALWAAILTVVVVVVLIVQGAAWLVAQDRKGNDQYEAKIQKVCQPHGGVTDFDEDSGTGPTKVTCRDKAVFLVNP